MHFHLILLYQHVTEHCLEDIWQALNKKNVKSPKFQEQNYVGCNRK